MGRVSTLIDKLRGNTLFTDSFWALIGSTIGKGLSLLAGIAVARFLGSEVYGEYGAIKNTLVYLAIVSTFGFGYTATKFIVDYTINDHKKVYDLSRKSQLITILFSSILATAVVVFAEEISIIIEAPHLKTTLRWSSVLIVLNAYTTTQIGILSGFKEFKKISYINTLTGLVTLVTSVIFTYYLKLDGALLSLLVAYIVQAIANHRVISNTAKLEVYNGESCQNTEIQRMLMFSLPIALQESLYTIVHWATLYLLIHYANYSEVGISSVASLWSSVVIFIPTALKNVMFSHLSSSSSHINLVNKLLQINFISTAIPVLILICLSGVIASIYGESFYALPKVLNVALISSVFISLSEVYCYEFIASGRPWIVFSARLIRDCAIVILCYVILKHITSDQAFYMACVSLCCYITFYIILFVAYKISLKNKII